MAKGKKYYRSLLTYLRLTDLLTAKSVLTYLLTLATCLGAPTMFITRMLAACSLAMVAWVRVRVRARARARVRVRVRVRVRPPSEDQGAQCVVVAAAEHALLVHLG